MGDNMKEFTHFARECMKMCDFFEDRHRHISRPRRYSKNISHHLGNGDIMRYVRKELSMNKPDHYEWFFVSKMHCALVCELEDWVSRDTKAKCIIYDGHMFQFDAILYK